MTRKKERLKMDKVSEQNGLGMTIFNNFQILWINSLSTLAFDFFY